MIILESQPLDTYQMHGDAEAALREAVARAEGSELYADLRRVRERIADRYSPGIDVRYREPQLGEFRIRQHYVVEGGLIYVLQWHAPVDAFADHADEFAKIQASFRLLERTAEAVARDRLRATAARCGSEIDWAPSWAAAAERARRARRPVLVLVRRYPGFTIPDQMRQGVFTDPDIVDLVGERFVALHLRDGMPAPFRAQQIAGRKLA